MMKRTGIMILGLIFFGWLLTAQAAPAEKTILHVMGTVTEIDKKHMVVKTTKGQLVSLNLTKDVRFKNKHHPQSNEPPTVGDRVIIEATKQNKVVTANVVHYSPMHLAPNASP